MSTTSTRRPRIATVIVAGVLAVGVAVGAVLFLGQGEPDVDEPVAAANPAATAEATASQEPTEPPAPKPVVPTGVGEAVPADLVEAARAVGASVYVSPTGDGTGLVVDPAAAVPESIRADIASLYAEPSAIEEFSDIALVIGAQDEAMKDSGQRAFFVTRAPHFVNGAMAGLDWVVQPLNIPDGPSFGSTISPTREGALALAGPMLAAYPDAPVIG